MRCLRFRTVLAASFALSVLMALAGCGGDRREHVLPHQNRNPERYERHDDRRHEERRDDRRRKERDDSDRHENRGSHSDRDRGDHGER